MDCVKYNIDGKPLKKEELVCATHERVDTTNIYKALIRSGSLYKKDTPSRSKSEWKLKSVSEECFNLYLEYLKTGHEFRYYEALRKV